MPITLKTESLRYIQCLKNVSYIKERTCRPVLVFCERPCICSNFNWMFHGQLCDGYQTISVIPMNQ